MGRGGGDQLILGEDDGEDVVRMGSALNDDALGALGALSPPYVDDDEDDAEELLQRLQAQNVPVDKSKRVLPDVIRTMYNPTFITELFRPQDIYSMQSTRQIFDRLAHSSIMRLNESSMDKVSAHV